MTLLFAGEPCSGQSEPSDAIDGKSSQLPDPEKETVRGSIISGGDGCRRSSFHGPDRNSERGRHHGERIVRPVRSFQPLGLMHFNFARGIRCE